MILIDQDGAELQMPFRYVSMVTANTAAPSAKKHKMAWWLTFFSTILWSYMYIYFSTSKYKVKLTETQCLYIRPGLFTTS